MIEITIETRITMKTISGWHHITNITSDAMKNYDFYTRVLGMRLIKKTVNQDDVTAYHTFFGDEYASKGFDLTFFDFPGIQKSRRGTNAVTSIGLRVPTDAALEYWEKRFVEFNVSHQPIDTLFGVRGLRFEDFDGLRLRLVSDEKQPGTTPGTPNQWSDVPDEFAIVGIGTIEITVRHLQIQEAFLVDQLSFRKIGEENGVTRFETSEGGNSSSIHVIVDQSSANELQGYGAVHHIALRVETHDDLLDRIEQISQARYPNSGFVNRHYFESLYTRVGSILYEFATDEPGFSVDEPIESLGESLSLPPFLESRRKQIEAAIRPFDTKRVNYRK